MEIKDVSLCVFKETDLQGDLEKRIDQVNNLIANIKGNLYISTEKPNKFFSIPAETVIGVVNRLYLEVDGEDINIKGDIVINDGFHSVWGSLTFSLVYVKGLSIKSFLYVYTEPSLINLGFYAKLADFENGSTFKDQQIMLIDSHSDKIAYINNRQLRTAIDNYNTSPKPGKIIYRGDIPNKGVVENALFEVSLIDSTKSFCKVANLKLETIDDKTVLVGDITLSGAPDVLPLNGEGKCHFSIRPRMTILANNVGVNDKGEDYLVAGIRQFITFDICPK